MNHGLRIECFRLALTLNVAGFWNPVYLPVDMLLDHALATLRCTPCAKRRRRIITDMFRIADGSPVHGERVQVLLKLADYFYTAETRTNVH